jgi:hypothetical protein
MDYSNLAARAERRAEGLELLVEYLEGCKDVRKHESLEAENRYLRRMLAQQSFVMKLMAERDAEPWSDRRPHLRMIAGGEA